jgi:glycerophosphoryl diester phosphodiesterase
MSRVTKLLSISLFFMFLMQIGQSQVKQIDLQGHRGCRGLMPENTIPAMIEAIKLGVTTLEMDMVITKDKQVILSHEPYMNLEIATPPKGTVLDMSVSNKANIYQMDYAEVQRWDVGLKVHPRFPDQQKLAVHKPLLLDLIAAVETYTRENRLNPVMYNIETKISEETDNVFHPAPNEFVELLTEVLKKAGIEKRTTIQSFDPRSLVILHNKKAPFKLSYLLEATSRKNALEVIRELGFKPDFISPEYTMVDESYVRDFHDNQIQVVVWTVNRSEDIQKMAALRVDGIISDYPNRFSILKQ